MGLPGASIPGCCSLRLLSVMLLPVAICSVLSPLSTALFELWMVSLAILLRLGVSSHSFSGVGLIFNRLGGALVRLSAAGCCPCQSLMQLLEFVLAVMKWFSSCAW